MKFKKIRVKNFRNFSALELHPGPRVNVFFGENAQGKTNFLESIYTLIRGKSFRMSEPENLLMHSQVKDEKMSEFAAIEGQIEKNKLNHKLQFLLTTKDKKILLNDKKVSRSSLNREFSTVLFSPESLSVIKNSEKERRDLLDELIVSVFHQKAHIVEDFKRALRQRNKLLKDLKDGVLEINRDNVVFLDSLTQNYLKLSTEVVMLRLAALEQMKDNLQAALSYVFEDSNVEIAVEYLISGQIYRENDEIQLYNAMYNRWLQLKSAEIKTGLSLVGPHKHDIRILLNEKEARFFCSQGQQRLIILAFKMAHIRLHFDVHGVYPILLLDDVLSEIDEKKRMKLIEYLETINAQIFITTTENTVLKYLDSKILSVFDVENGFITPAIAKREEISVR
jgi:DNA replication and repair protein RecF